MNRLIGSVAEWLKAYNSVAIWLEAIALIAIFVPDWRERRDQRRERLEQHRETATQLEVSQKQVEAAMRFADAANEAAQGAKKSAEIAAALHRPFMGVTSVALRPDPNSQNSTVWSIAWSIRNFGSLPAGNVDAKVEMLLEDKGLLLSEEGPRRAEVFPQSEPLTTVTVLKWEGQDRNSVMGGVNVFVVRVLIDYLGSDGRQYKHSADARFNRGYGTFSVVESHTESN